MITTDTPGVGEVVGTPVSSNQVTARTDAAPQPVTNVELSAVANDQFMTVTWRPATMGQAADRIQLNVMTYPGNQKLSGVEVPLEQGSKTIPAGLGSWYIAAYAVNSAGGAMAFSNPVTITHLCSTADACVHIETGAEQGTERLVAQGFGASTHNWVGGTLDAALTAAVRPRDWRIGSATESTLLDAFGARETQLISSHWHTYTQGGHGGYALPPWFDWSLFSSYVAGLVAQANAEGWAPRYWDLFNEPDTVSPSGGGRSYFSPADQQTVTTERLLQLYLVAYQAVRGANPDAKIVAPSMAHFHDTPDPGYKLDLGTFLTYAAANGMRLDAISWHESTFTGAGGADWLVASAPWTVGDHVARARRLIAQNPAVGNPVILINEYGSVQTYKLPAWNVGMFAAFERKGVAGASRTCWNDAECFNPTLDGLLAQTGPTWTGTIPSYWAARGYAEMFGGTRVRLESTNSWRLDGLAVRQDTEATIRLMLGQHWSCNQPRNPTCPHAYVAPPASADVSIDWPYDSPRARVVVSRIPAGVAAISGPTVVTNVIRPVVDGTIRVTLPQMADGDAYNVVVTAHG